jgi:DNA-directed RNA polymerase subunit RPC12/RpoP
MGKWSTKCEKCGAHIPKLYVDGSYMCAYCGRELCCDCAGEPDPEKDLYKCEFCQGVKAE